MLFNLIFLFFISSFSNLISSDNSKKTLLKLSFCEESNKKYTKMINLFGDDDKKDYKLTNLNFIIFKNNKKKDWKPGKSSYLIKNKNNFQKNNKKR